MSRFSEFQAKLESKGYSAKQAGGIAYSAGAKKYGKKGMAQLAEEGKRRIGKKSKRPRLKKRSGR